MSFRNWSRIVRLLPFALAALPAFPAERHNLILLMPKVLPAAAVDHNSAPALARLREEGVYFSNSHTGFPRLGAPGPEGAGAHADLPRLVASAMDNYSAVLVDDTPGFGESPLMASRNGEKSTNLDTVVDVLLPRFKEAGRPFVLVYRFGTAPGEVKPVARPIRHDSGGSDEPAVVRALYTADEALSSIEQALRRLELYDGTNIIVAGEQGVSFVWKGSQASGWINLAAEQARWGTLPPGFLAMDLIRELKPKDHRLILFDPDNNYGLIDPKRKWFPLLGNGAIGTLPHVPRVFIEAHGDHDLIYMAESLSKEDREDMAKAVVEAAFRQEYTSGVFVNEATVGRVRGAVSLEHIGARAGSGTRLPDIVVTFVSVSLQCDRPTLCAAVIADTLLDEGEVLRGSFSRADTWNFIAARGPDFQKGLNSKVPASNADVVRTMAEFLQLSAAIPAEVPGRVLVESLRGYEGMKPRVSREVISSKATKDGWITEVHLQQVGAIKYFYAAGGPGWTVGIAPRPAPIEWRPWKWDWPRIKRIRISIDSEDPEFEPFPPIFRDHKSP